MVSHNYQVHLSSTTVAASGTQNTVLDFSNVAEITARIMFEWTYAATASPTGPTIKLYYGVGVDADHIKYEDDYQTLSLPTTTASSGTTQTHRKLISLDLRETGRFVKAATTNGDGTNSMTFSIYGDQ